MKQLFCEIQNCDHSLNTIEEIVTGLCAQHYTYILDDNYCLGVCWQCGSITSVLPRRIKKNVKIKDKYIFSKGCLKCSEEHKEGNAWMTIKHDSPPSTLVTEDGRMVPKRAPLAKLEDSSNSHVSIK